MAVRATPSKGAKPDKLMRDALILALHRAADTEDGKPTKRLNLIADQLVTKAIAGDVPAIKEVFDRVDGKSVQPIGGDPNSDPIRFEQVRRLIVK
jgi:hypothetical protein